jgi:hypothetical protein
MNREQGIARDHVELSCLNDSIGKENTRHFAGLINRLSSAEWKPNNIQSP